MSFSIAFEYKYIYKTDFNPNVFLLSKLYAPFLSKSSFYLYVFMCEELRNFSNTKFFKNTINDLLKILNIDETEFNDLRNNLEALNLLKTYLGNDDKVYFELFEPLKVNGFLENKNFKSNFEEKLGKKYLDKLIAQYKGVDSMGDFKDLSVDPEKYFDSKNFKKENTFDFEKLFEKISSTTKFHIIISDEVKNEIEYYYKNFNLSFLEIERCVYDSLVKNKNKFEINLNLIQISLERLSDKSALNLREIIRVNHSNKMFIEKFSISDLNVIFNNYRNLKPEQFLSSLTLEELTENDIKIISTLKNKYLIAESLINIMIDFSIRKTHNELNSKYLYKMAKSFNVENIDSLEKAYDFLFSWDKKEWSSKAKKEYKTKSLSSNFYENNEYNDDDENIINNETLSLTRKNNENKNEGEIVEPIFEFDLT